MVAKNASRRALRSLRKGGVCAAALALTPVLALGCGGAQSLQTAALDQPVAVSLPGDDGAPAAIPPPGARYTVLEFWSPTCEPCKQIVPAVLKKRAELAQKGADLVHVAVLEQGQSANDAKATLAFWGVNERFVVDMDGAYMHKLGARSVPAFAIVDAAGTLRWVAPDGITISGLLAAIPE
ncbi:MAG: TlpA disulfide reductase family protein [Polyangiaceae bacterium]